jgi:acylphosphatase
VFFRAETHDIALRLGLTGYVRNLPSGDVEIVAEGEDSQVRQLVEWAHVGPPQAHVDEVQIARETPTGEFSSFGIGY